MSISAKKAEERWIVFNEGSVALLQKHCQPHIQCFQPLKNLHICHFQQGFSADHIILPTSKGMCEPSVGSMLSGDMEWRD